MSVRPTDGDRWPPADVHENAITIDGDPGDGRGNGVAEPVAGLTASDAVRLPVGQLAPAREAGAETVAWRAPGCRVGRLRTGGGRAQLGGADGAGRAGPRWPSRTDRVDGVRVPPLPI